MKAEQLYLALNESPVTQRFMDGVYTSDMLETIVLKPRLIIANTQPSDDPGEHWLLFFFNGATVNFFDSMGRDLGSFNKDIVNFVQSFSENYIQNKMKIQSKYVKHCGALCLYVAYFRCLGFSLEDIVGKMRNLDSVLRFVYRNFNIYDV